MKFELIISSVIAGVLWLSILQLSNVMFTQSGKFTLQENIKIRGESLSQIIEHDFNRMGFGVPGNGIVSADSSSITFSTVYNNDGVVRTVSWDFSERLAGSNEVLTVRMIDSVATDYLAGVSEIRLGYLDNEMNQTANFSEIRHIELLILSESTTRYGEHPERNALYKVISPRNIILQ